MGVIETILAIFCAIFGAALSRQVTDEFKAWIPWLIDVLVRQAIRGLSEDQRARYAEEWRSHVGEIPGDIGKPSLPSHCCGLPWRLSRILPKARPTSIVVANSGMPVFIGWPSAVILPKILQRAQWLLRARS